MDSNNNGQFDLEQEQKYGDFQTPPPTPAFDDGIDEGNGNVILGIIGAFLFSLVGGVLFFVLYQLEILAAFSGIVMFLMANIGYRVFAGIKNKNTIVGLVVSIVMVVVTTCLAEYLSLAYVIYDTYKAEGVTLSDAFLATYYTIPDPEVLPYVIKDLLFSIVLGLVGSLSNIKQILDSRKAQKGKMGIG